MMIKLADKAIEKNDDMLAEWTKGENLNTMEDLNNHYEKFEKIVEERKVLNLYKDLLVRDKRRQELIGALKFATCIVVIGTLKRLL